MPIATIDGEKMIQQFLPHLFEEDANILLNLPLMHDFHY
jgi:hypothetical protein